MGDITGSVSARVSKLASALLERSFVQSLGASDWTHVNKGLGTRVDSAYPMTGPFHMAAVVL